jgi:protein TonB
MDREPSHVRIRARSRVYVASFVLIAHTIALFEAMMPSFYRHSTQQDSTVTLLFDTQKIVEQPKLTPPKTALPPPTPAPPIEFQIAQPLSSPLLPQETDNAITETPPPAPSVTLSPAQYSALVSARLAAVKSYPAEARRLRQQGVAVLVLTLSRAGSVLKWQIMRSSGSEILDQEVARMVGAAAPFPRFPDIMTQSQETFAVPINFFLTRGG